MIVLIRIKTYHNVSQINLSRIISCRIIFRLGHIFESGKYRFDWPLVVKSFKLFFSLVKFFHKLSYKVFPFYKIKSTEHIIFLIQYW